LLSDTLKLNGKNDKFHYAPKCQISQKYVHQLKMLHEDIQTGTINVTDIFLQMFIPNKPQHDLILPEGVRKQQLLLLAVDLSRASELVVVNETLWTTTGGWDSSVNIVTRVQASLLRYTGPIPDKARDFSPLH
jgi:hypothetical protein